MLNMVFAQSANAKCGTYALVQPENLAFYTRVLLAGMQSYNFHGSTEIHQCEN